ncbi:type III secretion system outer membrane ring subunit SctC [Endozoicomonas lisbonensis]|uniref:Type 3 secretion system secretin n=1 Tax=Endozoicomonas lisbonensis TaxID=3120522 RepID=A0ABV2SG53_9GAMM
MSFLINLHRCIDQCKKRCIKWALLIPVMFTLVASNAISNSNWARIDKENARRHIVRPDETLAIIAENYGFDIYELISYNNITNPDRLMTGQTIYIPIEQLPVQPGMQEMNSLDAQSFPPREARPTQEEYYKLQQWLDNQNMGPGVDSVDYNYQLNSANQKPPLNQSPQQTGFDLPFDNDAKMLNQDLAVEAKAETERDTEAEMHESDNTSENVPDDSSPSLEAFGERPYAYYGSGEDLTEVLQNFAASYYIPTILAEDLEGQVNGKIGPLTPIDFLDHMSNVYGFIWYFDGHTLYVYNGNAAQQKIISLNYMSIDKFKKTLKRVGIWDGRFFWKEQPKNGLVYVSGPPRYVEMVTQTAELLDQKEGDRQKSQLSVRMFRLKYAWATDKQFNFRGQQVVVPGVSTLLRSIISGGGVAQVTRQTLANPSLMPARGVTRSAERKAAARATQDAASSGAQQLNAGAEAEKVLINADPRLNAIIVHDLESKMPMYEELIKSLDKPSAQVEVSVSIIDVNSQDISALGVDWNNKRGESAEVQFDTAGSAHAQDFQSFTTVVGMNLGSFNARLSLLADEGRAKVVSRPSILTLDNLEAVFDSSSTFYVKVESTEDAELFPVTSGTVVQVTPRIVSEKKGRKIHMSVNIQNGGDETAEGASLPKISNSSISTQAVVNESESLLIGGFVQETETENATKVPVLGDIPVLGTLFRNEKKVNRQQVRLFLITPRIISIDT